ncbi:hypothetical protein AEM42_12480 [Betaproteobacteria bacterium UKL13-2]|nr:hypothetical protein AEM42_12480 [Betaproteobacteria bacterium UKL13-2]
MISDFQLVLIGIIAVIIVGVIVYNRWQESRYKKRAEQMFAPERSDALFDEPVRLASAASGAFGASGTFERREPSFGKLDVAEQVALDDLTAPVAAPVGRLPAEEMVEPRNLVRGAASELVPAINAEVDTIAMMLADTPVHADVYAPMIEQSHSLGGNILWEGLVGALAANRPDARC